MFMRLEIQAKEYIDKTPGKAKDMQENPHKSNLNSFAVVLASSDNFTSETSGESNHEGISGIQLSGKETINTSPSCASITNTQVNNANSENAESSTCGFKMEKPKMPKFFGDVREYAIFKADFKYAIESRYSKRDAITFLRT